MQSPATTFSLRNPPDLAVAPVAIVTAFAPFRALAEPSTTSLKHLEPTQAAPSAIFVLTSDDIRRARATTIPQVLRLVPSVQAGQVDGNKWAVSMRGFNSREANKLPVLGDGSSIYAPLFSGTLWEAQDLLLEDLDSIEVVRGPGGTLWGANAFNGVINIVTRSTDKTQGSLAIAALGDKERYTAFSSPAPPDDASRGVGAGLRWEWLGESSDWLRISGDLFEARTGVRETTSPIQDVDHRCRNVVARWTHALADGNELQILGYYHNVNYDSFGYTQSRHTYDLESQQGVRVWSRHLLVWGAGFQDMRDSTHSGPSGLVDVLPLERNDRLANAFAEDTIALRPDLLNLTLGLKSERTDHTAAEWLPNVRLAYTPTPEQTWWASTGEATRVPSRLELGYRQLITPKLWFDVATFYNEYVDLRTGEAGGLLGNLTQEHSSGTEIAVRWEPDGASRVDLAYDVTNGVELDPQRDIFGKVTWQQ